ncbi:HD domain-containing protein [Lapidilactobacillus gannanensis]|jgi:HD superfamily phosphohydrolase|uniref:HD domain-containing protein n=1 Tax=Lapidilactobacillus gannanensis TaxID=2486002 RepID=A0ABW4BJJ9_9LACO|nr:HD domain-containing protein [Lapidilactobacillus gannanensis]MCH4057657.1 HD domain-containing protein [Lactobacillaceae bacterium]
MSEISLLPRDKVLRDPVHNYIHVTYQVILDLINTSEFQRLRRIKQLGASSYTFHGAEHSRFTHSVGVYEITRQICDNFARNYPSTNGSTELWDDHERLVAMCAALLHDIGHGPYSHTFEHIFNTDHEAITREILTSPDTEVNHVLRQVSPEFPEEVASVIGKTYPNPQVVQMISSQIDADRMDYLLRDAYHTGTKYGMFDLTRILRVMRPYRNGIAFEANGMHAVEDYIVCRFQMYQQVYFHPVSRAMEVILNKLLHRAKFLYEHGQLTGDQKPTLLIPFLENDFTLSDYLHLDDGVLTTYFTLWRDHPDDILRDLVSRFLDRRPLKSVRFTPETRSLIPELKQIIEEAGFNPDYYTAINDSYDLPYDAYDPSSKEPKTQIEIIEQDGTLEELSTVSPIVAAISGKSTGDERFFFPREMVKPTSDLQLFEPLYEKFQKYLRNDSLINPHEV